jgi:hypothetical protein
MSSATFEPATRRLQPREHPATWEKVVDRFGWNSRRQQLIDGLAEALKCPADARCNRVLINGSLVTDKEEPVDFDVTWDPTGVNLEVRDEDL